VPRHVGRSAASLLGATLALAAIGMMAATDARHFTAICPRVYRFAPLRMSKEQRAAIHSYDERVFVKDLHDGVTWYRRLVQNLG